MLPHVALNFLPFKSDRKLAEKLPGASLIEISGADHALMAEVPAAVTISIQAHQN